MKYPTIYKRTSLGAIQVWYQEIDDYYPDQYRTISGQLYGNLVISEWTVCLGTNIDKANQRTPAEQAVFEVKANYTKKLKKDYHQSIEDIDTKIIFSPMLAKSYKDYVHKIEFKASEISCQPKLDGIRLIATKQGLFTRNGNLVFGTPHIIKSLQLLFETEPNLILDGELYNHEYKDDFNALVSIIKKQSPTAEEIIRSEEMIEYHIYDIPSVNENFTKRYQVLKDKIKDLKSIVLVETHPVRSEKECEQYYENFLEEGYEGLMLRTNSPYVNKRTDALLKLKETIDQEFIVVDILEGLGNWAGRGKKAILRFPDSDVTFGAGIKGTREFCLDLLQHKEKYLGRYATVSYQRLTPDGIPRFGRVKEFNREDI